MSYLKISRLLKSTTLENVAALWAEIDKYRSAIPCPVGSEDWQTVIMPHVVLSGTDMAVDFYQRFLDEVEEREKNKQGVIPGEKHRLLTDMIPPWYNLGISSLIIDADHIDGRYYSLTELLAKIDAFIETVEK